MARGRQLSLFRLLLFRYRAALWCPIAIGYLVAGCGGGDLVLPGSEGPLAIRVVAGNDQLGSAGEPLAAPVVVEVTDAAGEPVEGATVEFVLTSAGEGADIDPGTALTSPQGRAEAQVRLGDKIGLQTGEARVVREGAAPVATPFSAVAMSDDNQPPDADFDWECEALTCRFSDDSKDDDGTLTGWTWNFGDGTTSTDPEPTHRYEEPGSYTVTLTVTDDEGGQDDSSEQLTATSPSAPPANALPRAEFDLACQGMRCSFTDRSTDADGNVVQWRWDFGDGATSSQRNPSHSYAAPGRYDVRLVVTDDDAAEDDRTRAVEPQAPPPPPPSNNPPQAEFDPGCQDMRCSFTDRSTDADGNVVQWRWDFGDGATSSQRNPSHTYAAPGRYDVRLVVTDDDGAEDDRTRAVEPQAPPPPPPEPNDPPRAEFEVNCQELRCVFIDRSSDEDGSIVSWRWDFGDGSSSSERNPSHSYATPGRYNVVLVVTDDDGAGDLETHPAEPEAPADNERPHAEFEVDCSERTCSFEDMSKDDDGVIVSWHWDFGDGATSGERNPVHTYSEDGRYDVLLTVTDDRGATDTKDRRAEPEED